MISLGAKFFTEDDDTYLKESGYALSGALAVHPNYVGSILQNGTKHIHQLPAVFSEMSEDEKSSFSESGADLSSIWYSTENPIAQANQYEFEGESFLLVAPGPSSKIYNRELQNFAKAGGIPLGVLSSKQDLTPDAVDFFFCSYPLTFLMGQFTNDFNSKVIAPFGSIPSSYKNQIEPQLRVEYGLKLSRGDFQVHKHLLIAPSARVHLYAIAYLAAHGVKDIYLAGFDGYPGSDPRNSEFMDSIRRIGKSYPDLSFRTLTPTKYDLEPGQLFQ